MSKLVVDGVDIICTEGIEEVDIPIEVAEAYLKEIRARHPDKNINSLKIAFDGEYANVEYHFSPQNFERIRRITGYLVGTTDRWNNAKRAEEHERVKHFLPNDVLIEGAEMI